MESQDKMHWKVALAALRNGGSPAQDAIYFGEGAIPWEAVQDFNAYGYTVPEEQIDYNDEGIDFRDIPELNEKTLSNGTYRMTLPVSLDYDVYQWIQHNHINYNEMINNLLKSVVGSLPSE